MPDDVTILVTSYNQEQWIEAAVRSALAQAGVAQVLVVDDGSTDASADVAANLGVPVIRRAHSGALLTYRAAVSASVTPFHLILNADDELPAGYVSAIRPLADEPTVGVVYTGVRWFGAREGIRPATGPSSLRELAWGNYIHASSLVRREAYEAVGGYNLVDDAHLEDWGLWVAIACAGWQFRRADGVLLHYRQHAVASRNPRGLAEQRRFRWRLARRHWRRYGPITLAYLVARQLASLARHGLSGSNESL